mgnify:CR=1 FL=1
MEIGTQLKTVKITSNIFAVYLPPSSCKRSLWTTPGHSKGCLSKTSLSKTPFFILFLGHRWFVCTTMLCGVFGSRVLGVRKAFLVLSRQIAPRNSLWGCLFVKKGLLGASSKRVLHNTYQGYTILGLLVFYLVFFQFLFSVHFVRKLHHQNNYQLCFLILCFVYGNSSYLFYPLLHRAAALPPLQSGESVTPWSTPGHGWRNNR